MTVIGIVANGPMDMLPDLNIYKETVDLWIGADRGALVLIEAGLDVDYAVGDFDSVNETEAVLIKQAARYFKQCPVEKDDTDLEIAIKLALENKPRMIYLFGVTGGRLDHTLINIQLLHRIAQSDVRGLLIDRLNQVELTYPGTYKVVHDPNYPILSFIPFSEHIYELTLSGFYYKLVDATLTWGQTLCLSNKLIANNGTFSYREGILLLVKGRED